MIGDPRAAGVALTGSERAGAAIAALAGQHLKKSLLELGGSDPFIGLRDADIEKAASEGVIARFQNTGQVCIAAKRFIVDAPIFDKFCEAVRDKVNALELGDPMMPDTFLGPMARNDLRDALAQQTENAICAGAKVVTSGGVLGVRVHSTNRQS